MAQDACGKSNPTLDKLIAECRTAQEISEVCKAQGEQMGLLVRERDGSVSVREQWAAPAASPAPQSGSDDTLLRRAVTLDDGTVRLIEAWSVRGLDVLEKALRTGQV